MRAYKVAVESTNSLQNTTKIVEGKLEGETYVDCSNGEVIVVTDNPKLIFDVFSVKRLEEIGPGYCLSEPPNAPS